MSENQLGALALLRNLRNMIEAKVPLEMIREGLRTMKTERVLPFRFITAARYAPKLEPELESAMFGCLDGIGKLSGKTVLCVDHSGSMDAKVSGRSELTRADAANALAMLLREVCEDVQVIAFHTVAIPIPPRRGFALRDAINGIRMGGTDIRVAVEAANAEGYDRVIVITDEQSTTRPVAPLKGSKAYFVNVASEKNGVGYGAWTHLDGWSEAIVDYIVQLESLNNTLL